MLDFLFKRSKSKRQKRISDYIEGSLKNFDRPPQEKEVPVWSSSLRQIENEVNSQIKSFQTYLSEIKDTSLRLEELNKMLESGEISKNAYDLLLNELGSVLSSSIEEIFKIRENLEVLRARAKIEWAKEKIGLGVVSSEEKHLERMYLNEPYIPLNRWKELVGKTEETLSTLTFEDELSIIERYLSIIRSGMNSIRSKGVEEAKEICRRRLEALSNEWTSRRRNKVAEIVDLEMKASQIKDEIKEVDVRFTVGEFDRSIYEARISLLRGSLRKIEQEISRIRNYIDEIDLKIFRANELLKEE